MKQIHKYLIPGEVIGTPIQLRSYTENKILTVQTQGNQICAWVEVDISSPPCKVSFLILGTGDAVPKGDWQYINTVQETEYVWHIYYELIHN